MLYYLSKRIVLAGETYPAGLDSLFMKVLLVEDHALFLDGITLVLKKADPDVQVLVGETLEDGLRLAQTHHDTELTLLDCHLPDGDGVAALPQFSQLLPNAAIVLLSAEENSRVIREALNSGARGFITKTSTSSVMLSAIQLVLSGGVYLPPLLLDSLSESDTHGQGRVTASTDSAGSTVLLTGRQQDVLGKMINGMSNKEIARELNMSPSTVKVHVAAILREFKVKNRTQAVNVAQANDFFSSP